MDIDLSDLMKIQIKMRIIYRWAQCSALNFHALETLPNEQDK